MNEAQVKVDWFVLTASGGAEVIGLNCDKCDMPLDQGDEVAFRVSGRKTTLEAVEVGLRLIHLICPNPDA